MKCHDLEDKPISTEEGQFKILLMGNPNVGKSVIFSKLTGMDVESSNYAGTTVSYTAGSIQFRGKKAVLIDVPGTYSLQATSPAEEVAVRFVEEGADAVICVLDATNLERNLNLALQLKHYGIPVVFSLNLADVAERQGIHIDVKKLEEELKSPVITTVAIRNKGLRELVDRAFKLAGTEGDKIEIPSQNERWIAVGKIIEKVQKIEFREPSFIEKVGDLTLRPFPGLPIAAVVLVLAVGLVVGGGKALRSVILLPIINRGIVPLLTKIVSFVIPEGIIRNILVGEFGVLVKGIEWPFALILPYVLLFYIVFSFLEDSGYLPRLGVLVDGLLRKLGIQGGNIIPIIMGYGCAVPAIIGTRAATTKKERLMVAGLISFAIPCAAQSGAFISLLGERSIFLLMLVYMISFLAIVVVGTILNYIIPGKSDPILLEIPNLLMPDRDAFIKKLRIRIRHFMLEAEVPMLLGILLAAFVVETGFLNSLSRFAEPFIEGWLGLPKEASLALILGIIRRELAVLPLLEMQLTTLQMLVGAVVALFYLPCLSVFAVLVKEFNLKVAVAISAGTTAAAFLIAGLIYQSANLIMSL
jgi:ferrous iron transport protein B